MVNRIAEALDSPLISVGGGPQHLRVQGGAKLSGSIEVRSSKNAAVALLCASLLNRGRTLLRGIARIEEVNRILEVLTSIGVQATWSIDGSDLELIRPAELDLGLDGPGGGPPHPVGDHVPRPAAALLLRVQPPLRRRLRPRRAHHRAAPAGPAPLRPGRRADRGLLRVHGRSVGRADAAHHAHRARRHRHRERAAGRRPLPRCHGAAQRQPELHGAGPVRLPDPPRGGDRRHRHHDAARARGGQHQHRRGVRAVGGPDRGDEPADRSHRHPVRDHHQAGADRVPRDRVGDPGGDGSGLLDGRRVRRGQRSHPAGGPDGAAFAARAPPSTRSTRCPSRASTSTTCPSSR